jgi:uncharacterized protein (DUF2384 family)
MENDEWLGALVDYLGVEDAAEWLRDPCPELGHRSPLEAVAEGDQKDVAALVSEMVDS